MTRSFRNNNITENASSRLRRAQRKHMDAPGVGRNNRAESVRAAVEDSVDAERTDIRDDEPERDFDE